MCHLRLIDPVIRQIKIKQLHSKAMSTLTQWWPPPRMMSVCCLIDMQVLGQAAHHRQVLPLALK
jgi:hypothetical protein